MARFQLYLIGSSRPSTVDVDVCNIDALSEVLMRTRYLRARVVDENGIEPGTDVLIPVCRVQLFAEVE